MSEIRTDIGGGLILTTERQYVKWVECQPGPVIGRAREVAQSIGVPAYAVVRDGDKPVSMELIEFPGN